jgi:hypothetical protein
MLPVYRDPQAPKEMSPRKKGVRQGGMLLLSGMVVCPILGVFASYTNAAFPEILVALAAIICFIGGPLRMLYAGLFEEGAPNPYAPGVRPYVSPPISTPQFGGPVHNAALPPPPAQSASGWRQRPITAELANPPSVTENTTPIVGQRRSNWKSVGSFGFCLMVTSTTGELLSSPLAEELSGRIRRMGKITFREWMEAALYYPTFGYYNRTDLKRWGRAGDYRTSPERSELFAATFARHFVHLYEQLNRPEEFTIVEVGGGDGQFATGVLETIEKLSPAVFDVTRYVCVELSQDARSRTAERLQKFNGRVEFAKLTELALIEAGIVFSNELIDAFPVHRVTSVDGKLKELFVDCG